MTNKMRCVLGAGFHAALFCSVLLVAGCTKPAEPTNTPPERPVGGPGGMGGGRMRGGGPGKPVSADASGADIYQAKCNCHGPEGKGGRAPVLTAEGSRPDADLVKIVHDGQGKMPAFGSQLSEAQIDKVVAYVKQLTPPK